MDPSALRILDANLNRAREGLRVAEEYARFALESAPFAERLKRMRHGLAEAARLLLAGLSSPASPASLSTLEASRDTPGDAGTRIATASEAARETPEAVARASMKRLEEALRALEEYGKLASAEAAAAFKRLRYDAYAVEPLLFASHDRRARLAQARLYVLVTGAHASTDALTAAREAAAGGADMIELREKELEDRAFYELALAVREAVSPAGALFLVNDRPHIAFLADADGVHTGAGDLAAHLARRLVGLERLIGRSTHAPADLDAALDEGADYAGVGPVYETPTKAHRAPVGLEYVAHASREAKLPWFAIGGIDRETLEGVLDAGARSVAVCRAVIGARDIAAEAAWFKARLLERT
ncbi:MAG: thiamine phosphate synthase [Planctomycetota bacterium]